MRWLGTTRCYRCGRGNCGLFPVKGDVLEPVRTDQPYVNPRGYHGRSDFTVYLCTGDDPEGCTYEYRTNKVRAWDDDPGHRRLFDAQAPVDLPPQERAISVPWPKRYRGGEVPR